MQWRSSVGIYGKPARGKRPPEKSAVQHGHRPGSYPGSGNVHNPHRILNTARPHRQEDVQYNKSHTNGSTMRKKKEIQRRGATILHTTRSESQSWVGWAHAVALATQRVSEFTTFPTSHNTRRRRRRDTVVVAKADRQSDSVSGSGRLHSGHSWTSTNDQPHWFRHKVYWGAPSRVASMYYSSHLTTYELTHGNDWMGPTVLLVSIRVFLLSPVFHNNNSQAEYDQTADPSYCVDK